MQSNTSTAAGDDTKSDVPLQVTRLLAKGGRPVDPARISSQTLFAGANEVEIEHKGALYRLRQTSLGKLILTK
nr:hemin uptake protein HemP [Rhodoferax sp.]